MSRKSGKINTSNINIHDRSLYLLGIGATIKSGGVMLVLWVQISVYSKQKSKCIMFEYLLQNSACN